jgi:hypothetical protein
VQRKEPTVKSSRIPLIIACLAVLAAAAADAATGWVLTGDYSQFGRLRSFNQASPWNASGDLAVTPGDAVGREYDGLLYVVGRGGASVLQIYDPAAGMALVREFSLGAGRNPQDIAFDTQGRAFVSCYDQAVLLRVDVQAGTVVQAYSTAAFADVDGLPETAWMLARGDRLFITCQKLDRTNFYAPSGPGALLVFDMASGQWVDANPALPGVQPIVLAGRNPYTRIEAVGVAGSEKLRVGCVGFYGLLDGGIDQVDPATLAGEGFVATEAQLGGDIAAFVTTGHTSIYAVVGDVATFNTNFVRWQGGPGSALLRAGGGFVYSDLAWDGGCQLFLADRTLGADGLRVFNACTGLPLGSAPVATGLPPFSFVLPADPVASPVPPATPTAALRMSPPFPNPCNPSARLDLSGPGGAMVQVLATDLAGRAVASWSLELDADGRGLVTFDGRGPDGRTLAAGVYRLTARGGGGWATRSITLLK